MVHCKEVAIPANKLMLSMLDVKELIVARMDPLEFLDALDISFIELVDKFTEEIGDNWEDIIDALNE